ncbi:CMRF35-like molecule 2 [Mauremys mutica]|uniref:CMRF35-like molecule 2 n=1 Tax=Mauremys mutica TaxID=74926 RepID=UPI001D1617F8|nr:CMRF35-like molecule 2 [Mauremys mutica]
MFPGSESCAEETRTMRIVPVLVWILFPGCWAVMGPGTAHGQLGGSVSVQCQYGAGFEAYPKFWCRRKVVLCFNHLIFETTGSEAEETWGRVSIRDNHTQRVITVTLENLTPADAGTYLCGVARIGLPNPRDSVKVIISPAAALPSIPTEKAPQATDQPAAPAFTWISTGSHVSSSFMSSSNSCLDRSGTQAQAQPNILYPLFLIVPIFLCIVCVVIWVSVQYRRNSREMVLNRHDKELPLSQLRNGSESTGEECISQICPQHKSTECV